MSQARVFALVSLAMIAFAGAMRLKADPAQARYDYAFTVRPKWPLSDLIG